MRKVITILLLLLFSLTTSGTIAIFCVLRSHAKAIARQIIRHQTSDFVVFQALENNQEVVWKEDNKEFLYKGQLYDVGKQVTQKGIKYYYCYHDKKETNIAHKIDKLATSFGNDSGNGALLQIMIWLAQVFLPVEHIVFHAVAIVEVRSISRSFYSLHYLACVLNIPAPPPWQRFW